MIYFLITWLLIAFLICMKIRPEWFPTHLLFRTFRIGEFPDSKETLNLTTRVLEQMNVSDLVYFPESTEWYFHYTYQNGRFVLIYDETSQSHIYIAKPGIQTISLEHIDVVRMMVNNANNQNTPIRFSYIIDDTNNKVLIHASTQISITHRFKDFVKYLQDAMRDIFIRQNHFSAALNEAIKDNDSTNDVEFSHASAKRIRSLLMEQFIVSSMLNDDATQIEASKVPDTMIGEWLSTLGFLKGAKLHALKVVIGDQVKTITSEEEILKTTLVDVLKSAELPDDGEQPIVQIRYSQFRNDNTADEYTSEAEKALQAEAVTEPPLKNVKNLTLTFTLMHRSEESDYYKMDYMAPIDDTLEDTRKDLCDAQAWCQRGSMYFAINKMDEQKMAAEYNYVINDAIDKCAEHKTSEMTEEQHMLINLILPDIGYCLYWGTRYMRTECYLQAFLMFRRARSKQTDSNKILNDEECKTLDTLNYWMGGCLYKLGRYKEAYYYLSLVSELGCIDYATLYVKCMRAMKDPRTRDYISRHFKLVNEDINRYKQQGMEVPEPVTSFRRFLRREEILLLMDSIGFLVAEPICQQMIKEDDDKEFAKEQLARIEKLKRKLIDNLHVEKSDNGIPTEFSDKPKLE